MVILNHEGIKVPATKVMECTISNIVSDGATKGRAAFKENNTAWTGAPEKYLAGVNWTLTWGWKKS